MRVNGIDVTDSGVEFEPDETIGGIETELTDRLSDLSGRVRNSRGEPGKTCSVIVFARDRRRWTVMSRHISVAGSDGDGRSPILSLPPGEYHAVALDHVDPADAEDPELLERLRPHATALSIIDGEARALELTFATLD